MMKNEPSITQLFTKYASNTCTRQELALLFNKIDNGQADKELAQFLNLAWHEDTNHYQLPEPDWDQMYSNIISAKKQTSKKRNWFLAYAAMALAVCAVGILLLPVKKPLLPMNVRYQNDLKPGTNGATLALANGKIIDLVRAKPGNLASKSGETIAKTSNGLITIYHKAASKNEATGAEEFNTLSTPAGGQYRLQLSDGTVVWLNAASTLKFPTRFNGSIRQVRLSGEAYFEVKHDPAQPFRVITVHQQVQVLGTHFDVNDYAGDLRAVTTLLQGSVKVTSNISSKKLLLLPGQAAQIDKKDLVMTAVDTAAAIAWKNGYFIFRDERLEDIMKQVARWYDAEVVYQDDLRNKRFEGSVSRFKNVSAILKKFELTETVHFKIEGRRITVMK